jgi:hypothetical protein
MLDHLRSEGSPQIYGVLHHNMQQHLDGSSEEEDEEEKTDIQEDNHRKMEKPG